MHRYRHTDVDGQRQQLLLVTEVPLEKDMGVGRRAGDSPVLLRLLLYRFYLNENTLTRSLKN